MKPLAVDLFCGLGGWTEGLLAEGYRVVGFDIERHAYGEHRYPAQLVIQDVLTIHGSQFKTAALIVASPPCQEYSYMAMPWSRAKIIEADYLSGVRDRAKLTALFDACFRIQREAIEAAGHHIPLVVENVRGAQKWVGRSRWDFGSFHLWGDVPALMPMARALAKVPTMGAGWYPPEHPKHVPGLAFNTHAERAGRRTDVGNGVRFTSRDCGVGGIKQGGDWFNKASGNSISRRCSSKSKARKHAAATIAKIPFVLSQHHCSRVETGSEGRVMVRVALALVLFVLVVVLLRVALGFLFAWWADRIEDRQAEERRRFEALIGLHERPVNYPPAKGAKGFENDVRHRRQA